MGARKPLSAYNINFSVRSRAVVRIPEQPDSAGGLLERELLAVARRVATRIRQDRESRPELKGVRALGLWLPSQRLAQISMNLTQPELSPLPPLFDAVCAYWREEAELSAVNSPEILLPDVWSEVIGLIPDGSLNGEPPERIVWRGFQPKQLLNYWLDRL